MNRKKQTKWGKRKAQWKKDPTMVSWYSMYLGGLASLGLCFFPSLLFIVALVTLANPVLILNMHMIAMMILSLTIPHWIFVSDDYYKYYKKKWKVKE